MSGNRSLDEFAEPDQVEGADGRRAGEEAPATEPSGEETTPVTEPSGEETTAEGTTTGEPAAGVDADDDRREAPDPPASTYLWRPGGGACAECGETVEERWRDGDDLVCAGCKDW